MIPPKCMYKSKSSPSPSPSPISFRKEVATHVVHQRADMHGHRLPDES